MTISLGNNLVPIYSRYAVALQHVPRRGVKGTIPLYLRGGRAALGLDGRGRPSPHEL